MGEKRDRIGLLYCPSTDWIAGAYYVQNIALALKTCEDALLPEIVVFCYTEAEYEEFRQITGYPYLKIRLIRQHVRKGIRFLGKIISALTFTPYVDARRVPSKGDKVKFVYPVRSVDMNPLADWTKYLSWIPDFQEKHLPHLFTADDLAGRDGVCKVLVDRGVPVILSSRDAQNDFFRFYPDSRNLKTFVLPFAVTHPDFSAEDIGMLKQRFAIRGKYLFCANQFWMHKNHLMLFKAFRQALDQGLDMQLVCSGKLSDYRNQEYSAEIQRFIHDNDLADRIILTGFIERPEQLCLMANSHAIVQPSLFEGWSTVVEDAKALNKFIFLSSLPVHLEQIKDNVCFFDPHDAADLTEKLLSINPVVTPHDYNENIRCFGNTFLNIIKNF